MKKEGREGDGERRKTVRMHEGALCAKGEGEKKGTEMGKE